jgi:hypothetical protein
VEYGTVDANATTGKILITSVAALGLTEIQAETDSTISGDGTK